MGLGFCLLCLYGFTMKSYHIACVIRLTGYSLRLFPSSRLQEQAMEMLHGSSDPVLIPCVISYSVAEQQLAPGFVETGGYIIQFFHLCSSSFLGIPLGDRFVCSEAALEKKNLRDQPPAKQSRGGIKIFACERSPEKWQ